MIETLRQLAQSGYADGGISQVISGAAGENDAWFTDFQSGERDPDTMQRLIGLITRQGTTFRIYLPLLPASRPEPGHDTTLATVKRGAETILLVEDEPALRTLVRTVLTRLGYRVLEAASGLAALEVWKAHREEIKLLLTDMVMPDGISGRELSQRLLAEKPDLKVIYTSGYSQEITGHDFPLQEGENFLAKPFQATKLAKVIRVRLDA
jgi:CheY-like chemotaxis protein